MSPFAEFSLAMEEYLRALMRDAVSSALHGVLSGMPDRADAGARDAYMSVASAAKFLGVSRRTVLRLMRTGALRAAKIGRQYRISRVDLDRALASPERSSEEHNADRLREIFRDGG